MAQLHEIYKCTLCGNIVQVVHAGKGGPLNCCGKDMVLMTENTSDGAKEKHVPVLEKTEKGWLVKVGSVEHPSTPEHYIEWIELICLECGKSQRKWLKPGDHPQAEFTTKSNNVIAREYCNLHGLWKAEQK